MGAGERRRLTILFCDLVGSTALSEQLDPEELGELVLAYQEMGRAVVMRFGGHIAQYLGDGLLAYFGYPSAHEDDAERAVLAGLAILDGLDALNATAPAGRERLKARVGIHAGPTIVGEMGSADRSDTWAFGSTPNIAARLESVAAPHTVVVSDEVRRFLDPRFELTTAARLHSRASRDRCACGRSDTSANARHGLPPDATSRCSDAKANFNTSSMRWHGPMRGRRSWSW